MAFHRGVLDFEECSLYRGNAVCSFYLFVLLFYYWEVVSEVTRPDQQALLSINIRWPVWAELLDSFYSCCWIGRFTWLSTTSRIIDWSVQLPSWGCAWWVMQEKPASAVLMMTMIPVTCPLYYVMVRLTRAMLWVDWVISSSRKTACSRSYYGP